MADESWVRSEKRRRSHAALREGAARAAGGICALGPREGDAVALLLGNGLPFLEASLTANRHSPRMPALSRLDLLTM